LRQNEAKNKRGTPWWVPFPFRGIVRGKRFIKEGGLFSLFCLYAWTNVSFDSMNR